MRRNVNGNIFFDVSPNLGSSSFSYKTAKAADINIFAGGEGVFTSLNIVSSVTRTSTLGMPVFSDIWLTRSAFSHY